MIAVTGAGGQLGTAFRRRVPEAYFLGRDDLDLSRPDTIRHVLGALRPTALINCAAYTAVDRAEEEESHATLVNGEAVAEMTAVAAELAIPFVTYSTDYVFDGAAVSPYVESSEVDPINAYGRSKLVGESAALAYPGSLVIRTSWVVSGTHSNFVSTMLKLAPDRVLTVVDDQFGRPTVAADLADATLAALDVGATGLLHLANEGETTWYQLAKSAVEMAGIPAEQIQPCTTADYPTPARRPAYSVLNSERSDALGLAPMPPWEASLQNVVAEQLARLV